VLHTSVANSPPLTVASCSGCSRACEKIVLQPREEDGAKNICDIVRFMLVCKTLSDMATLLNQIRDSSPDIKVVRFKDRITNPSGGWRDAMINFCVKGSHHICEVQIVHQKMAMCRRKDGLGGHDEYVQVRNACEMLEYVTGNPPEAQPEEDKRASVREGQEAHSSSVENKEAAGFGFTWVVRLPYRLLTKSHPNKSKVYHVKVQPAAIAANS